MKRGFLLTLMLFFGFTVAQQEKVVDKLMTDWHHAAAVADFDRYFNPMHEKSIYMGTDATERWTKSEFISFAKPYFDRTKRKSAWDFKAIDRHVVISKDGKTAWVDELLEGHMKICRGSGVLVKEKNGWKIIQYVLSMTIPNNNTTEVVKLKAAEEDKVIERFKNKK